MTIKLATFPKCVTSLNYDTEHAQYVLLILLHISQCLSRFNLLSHTGTWIAYHRPVLLYMYKINCPCLPENPRLKTASCCLFMALCWYCVYFDSHFSIINHVRYCLIKIWTTRTLLPRLMLGLSPYDEMWRKVRCQCRRNWFKTSEIEIYCQTFSNFVALIISLLLLFWTRVF